MEDQIQLAEVQEKPAIQVSERGGLAPTDFDTMYRLSNIMAASGLMPKGFETPEKVFVAVQLGAEVGLSPMQSVQHIAVINGRPSVWGKAALGLVRASGQLEEFDEQEIFDENNLYIGALCVARRKGTPGTTSHRFLLADAKQANLTGKQGPWQQYPRRMCQMRARGFVLSDLFPDVLGGLFVAEESQDIEPIESLSPEVTDVRKKLIDTVSNVGVKLPEKDVEEPIELVLVTTPVNHGGRPSNWLKTLLDLQEKTGDRWHDLAESFLFVHGFTDINKIPAEKREFAKEWIEKGLSVELRDGGE